MSRTPSRRARPAPRALLLPLLPVLLLAAACTPSDPPPAWTRADVAPETARAVELDCRQRAIEAIEPGTTQPAIQAIHRDREAWVTRCMRGSGFSPAK